MAEGPILAPDKGFEALAATALFIWHAIGGSVEQAVNVDFTGRAHVDFPVRDGRRNKLHRIACLIATTRGLRTVPQFVREIGCVVGMQQGRSQTCRSQVQREAVNPGGMIAESVLADIDGPHNPVSLPLRRY